MKKKIVVKIERTARDLVAAQLSDARFHQRVVKDKKKYTRNRKDVDFLDW